MGKKIKKHINKIILFLLIVAILAIPISIAADEAPPEGFDSWDDYYNYLINGEETQVETPPLEEMTVVGENSNLVMYYHEEGADFFLKDKNNEKVWGSAIPSEYMDTSSLSQGETTKLLVMGVVDEDESISYHDLNSASEEFSVTSDISDGKLSLAITHKPSEISFELQVILEENGITCTIPQKSISEKGPYKLLAIELMPIFGAASSSEEGYIFFPDGSGSLINIKPYELPSEEIYKFPLYGLDMQDLEEAAKRKEQDIKNIMLPVFGIKHTKGAVFAAITKGEATGILNISMGKTYKASFLFNYRIFSSTEIQLSQNDEPVVINKLIDKMDECDRSVRYFLLNKDNTYSDMAKLYRDMLEKDGVLKKTENQSSIPLSIDFFMGTEKSGLLGNSQQTLTTYDDVKEILTDLSSAGVKNVDSLLSGWGKKGYTAVPTNENSEGAQGGNRKLKELIQEHEKAARFFLNVDLINADSQIQSFNAKKFALKDVYDRPVTDLEKRFYWLNPASYLENGLNAIISKHTYAEVALNEVGSWLIPDFSSQTPTSRFDLFNKYSSILLNLKNQNKTVAVFGGNSYTLPYAQRYYDIPDNDSGYYQADLSVPFFQMVVHGYIDYSSLAGNRYYDYNIQKLRWIETGSIPHFQITKESPVLLQNTEYNSIFSSKYDDWRDNMIEIYKELNENLGSFWNEKIESHEILKNNVVKVVYGKNVVYINYGKEAQILDGVEIKSQDYKVIAN